MKIIKQVFDNVAWYVSVDKNTSERLTSWVKDKNLISTFI